MPITDGIVVKPVGMGDISTAIGLSSLDLGTLCQSSLVNMWAKYKSTKKANLYGETGKTSGSTYWKADNEMCGLAIPTDSSLGNPTTSGHFLYKLLNGTIPWTRDYPTGGTLPFRMLDFDGYMHGAITLTPQVTATQNLMLTADNKLTVPWLTSYAPNQDEQLQYSDIKLGGVALSSCYFGMLLFNPNNNRYAYIANQTVSGGNFDVTFDLTGLTSYYQGATCKVVPFVSTKTISLNGTPATGVVLASWNCVPANINVQAHTGNFDATLSASWNAIGGTTVNYTLTVKNNSGTSRNATQIYIVLTSGSASGTVVAQTGPVSISSISGNGGSKSYTGSFTNLTYATNLYITARSTATTDPIPETSTQVRLPIEI